MTLTSLNPNTIFLGGDQTPVNDVPAGEAITPGHLVVRYSDSGTVKYKKHATAGGAALPAFALNQSELNKDIDTAYAAGDLVQVGIGHPGATYYALIASGENITAGGLLESAGDGTLRAFASGTPVAGAVETVDNSAGPSDARIRVETL